MKTQTVVVIRGVQQGAPEYVVRLRKGSTVRDAVEKFFPGAEFDGGYVGGESGGFEHPRGSYLYDTVRTDFA